VKTSTPFLPGEPFSNRPLHVRLRKAQSVLFLLDMVENPMRGWGLELDSVYFTVALSRLPPTLHITMNPTSPSLFFILPG
jgi:hypothetical protein